MFVDTDIFHQRFRLTYALNTDIRVDFFNLFYDLQQTDYLSLLLVPFKMMHFDGF